MVRLISKRLFQPSSSLSTSLSISLFFFMVFHSGTDESVSEMGMTRSVSRRGFQCSDALRERNCLEDCSTHSKRAHRIFAEVSYPVDLSYGDIFISPPRRRSMCAETAVGNAKTLINFYHGFWCVRSKTKCHRKSRRCLAPMTLFSSNHCRKIDHSFWYRPTLRWFRSFVIESTWKRDFLNN